MVGADGGKVDKREYAWRTTPEGIGSVAAQSLMTSHSCPDRAIVISASPPDPRAVEVAQHPPGQADVQNSLPGRHGEGRARSKGVLRARPFLSRFSDTPQGSPAGPANLTGVWSRKDA